MRRESSIMEKEVLSGNDCDSKMRRAFSKEESSFIEKEVSLLFFLKEGSPKGSPFTKMKSDDERRDSIKRNSIMRGSFIYEKEVPLRKGSSFMRRGFDYGKGSSIVRRKFVYKKEVG